jgi:transporter family protein
MATGVAGRGHAPADADWGTLGATEYTDRNQQMPITSGWLFWALLSAVFAALTAIFAKIGIQGVDSDLATLIRTAIVLLVLATFVAVSGKWLNPLTLPPRTWLFLALSALATGISWACYFRALQVGQASQVAPVDKLSVMLVALFAVAFLGERPSVREWLGIMLIGGGVLLLALKR